MFIIAIILAVIAVILIVGGGLFRRNDKTATTGVGAIIAGVVSLLLALVLGFFSTWYQNGAGEAKVVINSVERTIVRTIDTPGSGFRSPFEEFVEFDLFSQQLAFAGNAEGAPSYTGGSVNGQEITVNVGGVSGGSTRANVDLVATYSLGTENLDTIYSEFRSQERFTEQIIQKQILSIARQVAANYSAVEFRGTSRGEAEEAIRAALNDKLAPYGVEFTTVTIQDVRYSDSVESALNAIEEANQAAEKAEADQRTAEVQAQTDFINAQGAANAQIETARGEAEANRLLNESLTPQIVELRRIEALQAAAESGNIVIDGSDGNVFLDAR